MKTLNNGKVIISKALFSEIKRFYSYIFSEVENHGKDSVVVNDKEIIRIIDILKEEASITNANYVRKIDNISKEDFENALNEYTTSKCEIAKSKFEHENTDDNLYDKLIANGLKLVEEKMKIMAFPALKKHITEMIQEIKSSNTFTNIGDIEKKFHKLCNTSGRYEEFKKLSRNLSKIISDTYLKELTDVSALASSPEFYVIASEDDEESCFLLSSQNISKSSCGVILSPENNIKRASNDQNSNDILPFKKIDKKQNYIEVYDFKPIACYAVTLGERTLSDNYLNAQKLSRKYHNVPLIEIDITRCLPKNEQMELFRDFIDKLLDDKNVNFSKKDDEFYKRFEFFFDEFKQLKSSKYDEGKIRNIFDVYMKLLSSQEVCNLENLLENYSLKEVETVMKYNIFMDDNIFRHTEVTKPLLEKFIDKFYTYRLDKKLNSIYPGFSIVLEHLKSLSDEELKEVVEVTNSFGTVDSWLLAQTFKPTHENIVYLSMENENNFKAYLNKKVKNSENEKEKLMSLKEYLSSLDEDKKEEKSEEPQTSQKI